GGVHESRLVLRNVISRKVSGIAADRDGDGLVALGARAGSRPNPGARTARHLDLEIDVEVATILAGRTAVRPAPQAVCAWPPCRAGRRGRDGGLLLRRRGGALGWRRLLGGFGLLVFRLLARLVELPLVIVIFGERRRGFAQQRLVLGAAQEAGRRIILAALPGRDHFARAWIEDAVDAACVESQRRQRDLDALT